MSVQILDPWGRPVKPRELETEVQTSRLGHLQREFAEHPSRGLTPAKLASILQDAEEGYILRQAQLGEDIEEKDAHLYAEIVKRKNAIVGVEWTVDAPVGAGKAEENEAAAIKEMLDALDMEEIIFDVADAILKGYACLEITWEKGPWRPVSIDHRPADWFMTRPEDRNTLLLRSLDGQGEPLRPYGWVRHEHKAKSGYLVRGGLARILAWPYMFRNYSVRDFAEFLEVYGQPLKLGKYPHGASSEEKNTLLKAVVGIGHSAAGIIPKEMEIEIKAAAEGSPDAFMAMIDWAERSMSKAILGATLTTQTDQGSGAYALGQVHNEVRHDILVSDLRKIARTLTRDLVWPIARMNSKSEGLPRFKFVMESQDDLKLYGELVQGLASRTTMRISKSWAHKFFRIPEAAGDDDVLEAREVASPFLASERRAPADVRAAEEPGGETSPLAGGEDDGVDAIVEKLATETAPLWAAMHEKVLELLDSVTSLEEFGDRLLEVFPELDDSGIAKLMGDALTAAELAGRSDILEGK